MFKGARETHSFEILKVKLAPLSVERLKSLIDSHDDDQPAFQNLEYLSSSNHGAVREGDVEVQSQALPAAQMIEAGYYPPNEDLAEEYQSKSHCLRFSMGMEENFGMIRAPLSFPRLLPGEVYEAAFPYMFTDDASRHYIFFLLYPRGYHRRDSALCRDEGVADRLYLDDQVWRTSWSPPSAATTRRHLVTSSP
ncbi:kinase-like protein [Penicillium macrosclerotiorum]|uniref:kinase-like protein n=1 Tax=Penicillium macrosclerotiorum TaxID=303699 RepID=UPI0025498D0B|nr:kinase-like protein [Penicillium macrosclerotiorum]KAJ5675334.1 kinase-like protein [Penicillium macrosclerotiorum]